MKMIYSRIIKKHIVFFISSLCLLLTTACAGSSFPAAPSTEATVSENQPVRIIEYEIMDEEYRESDIIDTIYKIQLRAARYSDDIDVYQKDADHIVVKFPLKTETVYSKSEEITRNEVISDNRNEVADAIGHSGKIEFITYDEKKEDGSVNYDIPTVWLTGDDISGAQIGTQQEQTTSAQQNVVQLSFNEEGTKKFAEATTSHIGDVIYILYDDEVVSNSRVNSAITNGNAIIEGDFTYEEAEQLAYDISIGALNLELEVVADYCETE